MVIRENFIYLTHLKPNTTGMKNKFMLRLCLMMTVMLSLYSCISDDFTPQENPSETLNSARFSSKSLWEEDEKYISKVKEVYGKNADENYIQQTYGTIFWDYATTMDQFDESYLMVPVLKNNKVVNILEVFREKNRVYFQFSADDLESNEFFQTLIFDRGKIKAAESSVNKNVLAKGGTITVSVCKKYTIIVGYVEGASGEQYPIESTKTICKFVEMALPASQCLGVEDPATGECMGGGTGTGESGFEYPEPPEEEDPCEKIKAQNQNINFKGKVSALDKQEMFTKEEETGYAAAYGTVPFEQMLNNNDGNVKLPDGNKYFGYLHVHLNKVGVVKIFSPYDVATFLTSCVRNAQQVGSMADAYAMVITSQGNYILKYSGDGNYSIGPNQIKNWENWYDKQYENLKPNELADPNILEKIFTQFLEEKVNIDGLEVYQADKTTGNATKLQYNGPNNPVQPIPCPNN